MWKQWNLEMVANILLGYIFVGILFGNAFRLNLKYSSFIRGFVRPRSLLVPAPSVKFERLCSSKPSLASASATTLPECRRLKQHADIIEGSLDNGLRFVLLPHKNPAGKFDAHLEILSGSLHELNNQVT